MLTNDIGLTQLRVILYRNPMVLSLGNRIQLRNSYDILQLYPFQVVPDPLVGVQLGGVGWQLLQMDSLAGRAGQKSFDLLAPVNGTAIPDDQQPHRDVGGQVPQETGCIPTTEGPVLYLGVQPAMGGDAADHRQMIPAERGPEKRRMTWVTLGWVHTSPRKPKAWGLWTSNSSNWSGCWWVNLDLRAGGLRWCRAWGPSALARLSHWLTAPLDTPRASAMRCWCHPSWNSSQARRRRPSRQLVAC